MRTIRHAALACCCTLLPAACTGDDDTFPTEPPVVTRETVVSTTAPPTTVTEPTTTAPPTTPTPTLPPTTPAPPTPPPAIDPTEAEVLAVVEEFYVDWRACLKSIQTCDPATFEPSLGPLVLDLAARQLEGWRAAFREAERTETYTHRVLSVTPGETRYVVTICEEDGTVVYERPPDGPERLITDEFMSRIRTLDIDRLDTAWHLAGTHTTQEATGMEANLCV